MPTQKVGNDRFITRGHQRGDGLSDRAGLPGRQIYSKLGRKCDEIPTRMPIARALPSIPSGRLP